jgi:hypothetical protein
MPFRRINSGKGKGKYKSPSGRVFTRKQVKMYYATGGTFKRRKRK